MIFPGLVIAPVFLVLAHELLGLDLLFPIFLLTSTKKLFFAAFVPGVVLLLASGLGLVSWNLTRHEYFYWRTKKFLTTAVAYGKNPDRQLLPLILTKSLSAAWIQCMPWIFGELLLVEVIFNAPGLGLDAWRLARVRDLWGLLSPLLGTGLLFTLSAILSYGSSRWIGRRLEGYH
jgi:ABC-type dipeptide/oligopeptide/nickel transport system permease component